MIDRPTDEQLEKAMGEALDVLRGDTQQLREMYRIGELQPMDSFYEQE